MPVRSKPISPSDALEAISSPIAQAEWIRTQQPMLFYKPHSGQIAFHRSMASTEILTGGNRSGKTEAGVSEDGWAITGTHPIKKKYRPSSKSNPFKLRVISEPRNFKRNIQPKLLAKLPTGSVKQKYLEDGYYKEWTVEGENADGTKFYAFVDFISKNVYATNPTAFESVECDLIHIDEDVPYGVYEACTTRIGTSKWGLRIIFTLTPLEAVNWMYDEFFTSPPADTERFEMTIMDNMISAGGYLPDDVTQRLIDKWKKDPVAYDARILGKFVMGYRAIFPLFKSMPDPKYNEFSHVVDQDKEKGWRHGRPDQGTLYLSWDPHDTRPHVVQFWVADTMDDHYCVDELPDFYGGPFAGVPFDKIENYRSLYSLPKLARDIIRKARNFHLRIGGMAVDPHFATKKYPINNKTIMQLLNEELYKIDRSFPQFSLATPKKDGSKEIIPGHEEISNLIGWDIDDPMGFGNYPKMFWTKKCFNSIRSMQNFRREDRESDAHGITEDSEKRYKHFIDTIRYYLGMNPYHYMEAMSRIYEQLESSTSVPVNAV